MTQMKFLVYLNQHIPVLGLKGRHNLTVIAVFITKNTKQNYSMYSVLFCNI